MKKTITLLLAILVLLVVTVSPIYASSDNSLLPPWFTNAIKPIQDSISSLFTKVDNHETRITELENKIGILEGKIISLETQIADMKKTNLTIGTGNIIGTSGMLYYQNNPLSIIGTSSIGIGTSSPTVRFIMDCGIYNCSDLLKIPTNL